MVSVGELESIICGQAACLQLLPIEEDIQDGSTSSQILLRKGDIRKQALGRLQATSERTEIFQSQRHNIAFRHCSLTRVQ